LEQSKNRTLKQCRNIHIPEGYDIYKRAIKLFHGIGNIANKIKINGEEND